MPPIADTCRGTGRTVGSAEFVVTPPSRPCQRPGALRMVAKKRASRHRSRLFFCDLGERFEADSLISLAKTGTEVPVFAS